MVELMKMRILGRTIAVFEWTNATFLQPRTEASPGRRPQASKASSWIREAWLKTVEFGWSGIISPSQTLDGCKTWEDFKTHLNIFQENSIISVQVKIETEMICAGSKRDFNFDLSPLVRSPFGHQWLVTAGV